MRLFAPRFAAATAATVTAAAVAIALAACSEPGTAPQDERASAFVTTPSSVSFVKPSSAYGANPLNCPSSTTETAAGIIGPLGGVLSAGGTVVTIPIGAVLAPTSFTITIPASKYMEVDISAAGVDHFLFELPVIVSIDYSRCTKSQVDRRKLTVWYFGDSPKQLLENMGGIDDKTTNRITFTTPHLSGYVIAD